MKNPLTNFEKAVVDKLLAGDSQFLHGLRRQLPACWVVSREFTGAGFMTSFCVDDSVQPVLMGRDPVRIGDVAAVVEGLEYGAGFLLYVSKGHLDALEGYSYDEPWPRNIGKYELKYINGCPRDLSALDLDSDE